MLNEDELRTLLRCASDLRALIRAHEPPSFMSKLRAEDERRAFDQEKLLMQAEGLRSQHALEIAALTQADGYAVEETA
jgi:hypothetical protein